MIELPTDENPIVILHGDCQEILPQIPAGVVDAVVTDPPYGMKWHNNQRFSGGKTKRGLGTRHDPIAGDDRPFDPRPLLKLSNQIVIWGANHFWDKLPSGASLIWLKRNDASFGTFLSDAEIAYLSRGCGVYVYRHVFSGSRRAIDAGQSPYEGSAHPNQKPVALMRWCIQHLPKSANVILDPFAGSGTTGVAAILEGRKAILIEKDAGYVEVIKKRIAETLGRPTTLANGRTVGRNLFHYYAMLVSSAVFPPML